MCLHGYGIKNPKVTEAASVVSFSCALLAFVSRVFCFSDWHNFFLSLLQFKLKKHLAMAKEKQTTEKPVDTDKLKDDNAVQDTVAPAPKIVYQEGEEGKQEEVKAVDMPKTVNIPVSASNALSPEAGIQVIVPSDAVEEVVQTDAYDKQKSKPVNVLKDDYEVGDTGIKAKYEQLANTFREVLDNHTLDFVHKNSYLTKAGLK